MSNHARSDPRLLQEIVRLADMDSVVLVPMLSEGAVLGLLVAANKPGGFTDADVQLLSMFAGPAASFIRSRQIFSRQRVHAARIQRVAALVGGDERGPEPQRAPADRHLARAARPRLRARGLLQRGRRRRPEGRARSPDPWPGAATTAT